MFACSYFVPFYMQTALARSRGFLVEKKITRRFVYISWGWCTWLRVDEWRGSISWRETYDYLGTTLVFPTILVNFWIESTESSESLLFSGQPRSHGRFQVSDDGLACNYCNGLCANFANSVGENMKSKLPRIWFTNYKARRNIFRAPELALKGKSIKYSWDKMWEAGELWAHRQPNCVKSHFPHSVFIDSTPIHKTASIGSDKLFGPRVLAAIERGE